MTAVIYKHPDIELRDRLVKAAFHVALGLVGWATVFYLLTQLAMEVSARLKPFFPFGDSLAMVAARMIVVAAIATGIFLIMYVAQLIQDYLHQ